jgi:tellurite resistance protein TerC
MLALVVVETTDLIFAIDSIPAVIGLTRDPFLVFTSNVFAILGLRSLYFALADLLGRFHLLKYSLVIILAFVGAKMMLEHFILERLLPHDEHGNAVVNGKAIVNLVSFAVIALALVGGVIASFVYPDNHKPAAETPSVPA